MAKYTISANTKVYIAWMAKVKAWLVFQMQFQSLALHLRFVQKRSGRVCATIPQAPHVASTYPDPESHRKHSGEPVQLQKKCTR